MDNEREDIVSEEPYVIFGNPSAGEVLVIGDHASNRVPNGIELGIDPSLMDEHIALDIGVAPVAHIMCEAAGFSAYLGNVSRLVTDFNRYAEEDAVIPIQSDGIEISGNRLDEPGRQNRIKSYHRRYHDHLTLLLREARPALILSLHSFTPQLQSKQHEARPWEVGILYNEQEAPSKVAIDFLRAKGMNVGDQLPYSGKLLNATMNRHAEANDIPYVGVEMRQDLVDNSAGQERFAAILGEMAQYIKERLASGRLS